MALPGASSDHFVQFYEGDEFLVESVSQFVTEGLADNGNAVVIATPQHREGLAARLEVAGFTVDSLVASGRYVALDARETLVRLMEGDQLSEARFEEFIGLLVSRLTAGNAALCAFGEMVALLWADGKAEAAARLEELWSRLCQRHTFRLFCAYPIKDFASSSARQPFLHICQAHSRVLPAEGYSGENVPPSERLRIIAGLQQKAAALENEIVERKRVEDRLRQRETELTSLLENASLSLHWVDAKGVIAWANKAELEMLGYAASEYIGRPVADFHADRALIEDILLRLGRGEKLKDCEARVRCKDGTLKTVLIDSSALWDGDRFVHTQCFTRDVTEQRQAERNSLHLAAIVESSDDAIFSKNLDGIITSWNAAAERIFGYTTGEIVGRSITLLIPPDRFDEEAAIIARLRRGERIDHFETVRQRKDGTLLDVSVTISPVRDRSGKIIGASKIARDITGRKHAEKALDLARQELAQKNEELETRVQERTASLREAVAQMEEFSYTVSHDLRAPLRGMQVYSQALLEDYGASLDPQAQHCLRRIAENSTRLDRMVMDVLTFSRISREELSLQRMKLDLFVRELIQHYPTMQPPRAQVEVAQLHDVIGHEPSLTQIISNLLSNAVKFVAPGVLPTVRVWTECEGGRVKLWVRDNGIGIKPDRQARLFRMFERVHPELSYDGSGVGLAIVRKAALRMGGDVGVLSDGANGTTFWVQLPAAEGAA